MTQQKTWRCFCSGCRISCPPPHPRAAWLLVGRGSFLSRTFPTRRWFPELPCHFQGQPCRPKDKIEGMQNEHCLVSSTCKADKTLKVPGIQGRRQQPTPSPQGLLTHCVKGNGDSSSWRKEVTPCFAPAVFILEKPQVGAWQAPPVDSVPLFPGRT